MGSGETQEVWGHQERESPPRPGVGVCFWGALCPRPVGGGQPPDYGASGRKAQRRADWRWFSWEEAEQAACVEGHLAAAPVSAIGVSELPCSRESKSFYALLSQNLLFQVLRSALGSSIKILALRKFTESSVQCFPVCI